MLQGGRVLPVHGDGLPLCRCSTIDSQRAVDLVRDRHRGLWLTTTTGWGGSAVGVRPGLGSPLAVGAEKQPTSRPVNG
mgnify:CR=1 FL=1